MREKWWGGGVRSIFPKDYEGFHMFSAFVFDLHGRVFSSTYWEIIRARMRIPSLCALLSAASMALKFTSALNKSSKFE